jgi:hypothetical protein
MTNIKKLRVFDFDDTLFHTTAKVLLKQGPGKFTYLTPAEYAVYEPKPSDEFDFSQFDQIINPSLIKPVAKRFYKIINAGLKDRLTVILTARGPQANKHIKEIINKIFRVDLPVITLGTGSPQAKADWIVDKINNEGYNDIFFIDDSPKNGVAVYKSIKDLPVKYKVVDLSTPKKYEGNNLDVDRVGLSEDVKNIVDKERLKKAYKFFVNELSLPSGKIKLEFGSLDGDVQGKVKVEGDKNPYKIRSYVVIMRTNSPHSGDDQIKTLAHELHHIKQVEDGRLNVFENSWDGKVYPKYDDDDPKERMLPWEIDARMNAEQLYIEYNRYAREKGAATKIIKIK